MTTIGMINLVLFGMNIGMGTAFLIRDRHDVFAWCQVVGFTFLAIVRIAIAQ